MKTSSYLIRPAADSQHWFAGDESDHDLGGRWKSDLVDEAILEKLVSLNLERSKPR